MKKTEILRGHNTFSKVFTSGDRLEGEVIRCFYLVGEGNPELKFGVNVPSRIGNAVRRSRLKRLMRLSCAREKGVLWEALRMAKRTASVVFVFKGSRSVDIARIRLSQIQNDTNMLCKIIAKRL